MTALKTNLTFVVSVAHVTCVNTDLSGFLFFLVKALLKNSPHCFGSVSSMSPSSLLAGA